MADIVNTGTAANDGSGDDLRTAFQLINERFQQLLGTLSQITWAPGLAISATPLRQWTVVAGQAYVAASNHIAGATFAADLAAGRWLAVDVAQVQGDLDAFIAAISSPASGNGDEIVGSNDGAGGSLWTTVAGFISRVVSSAGASVVGFIQSGAGAVIETVQKVLRQRITVTQFGALGDGIASDTAAFIAAYTAHPGKTIYMPEPAAGYKLDGLLTLPAGTIFKGDRRHGTKLIHAYNGDFANLGDGAGFEDCWIDGQGGTFTGGCFVFSGTNGRQIRRGVRATDFDGPIESFAKDAGSQSTAVDVRYSRRNAGTGTNRFSVVIDPVQMLGAVPRKFVGFESDGQCSFDFGGCNNIYIAASFLGDLKYTAESRGVLISGSRIANQLALTVDGHNNTITGCDVAPQITVAPSADAIAIQGNTYNNLPVIDNSGNGRNLIDHWAVDYTPALTSGGTAPTLGNGTITGKASRSGSTGRVTVELTVGSTTNLGTGDLHFSIPTWMPNNNANVQYCGTAVVSRGATLYTAAIQAPAVTQWVRMVRDTTGVVTFNSPATWAAGDVFRLTFEYDIG